MSDRFCLCDRTTKAARESPICRDICLRGNGPRLGHTRLFRAPSDNTTCLRAGTSLSGSDGTRTRDLRRDRPLQAVRLSATNAVESLCSCWFASARRRLSAWLRRGPIFRRLLPVCCPGIDCRRVRWSTERPPILTIEVPGRDARATASLTTTNVQHARQTSFIRTGLGLASTLRSTPRRRRRRAFRSGRAC